jgi:PTH2 family peptidyl-tRNA hydrolase
MKIKQVIIMRKFPSLRTGKYIAQGAHASQIAIRNAILGGSDDQPEWNIWYNEYMASSITKIVVYVNTTEELEEVYASARKAKLPCSFIEDSGFTEFKGVKTPTAVAIGPAPEELINSITGKLPLF